MKECRVTVEVSPTKNGSYLVNISNENVPGMGIPIFMVVSINESPTLFQILIALIIDAFRVCSGLRGEAFPENPSLTGEEFIKQGGGVLTFKAAA